MIYPEAMLSSGPGTGPDCLRNSGDPGHRKVQRCAEQGIVELSTPSGETCETGCTGCTVEGMPLFNSFP